MGLAGPKVKQRIGPDPQNKRWREDENAVGMKMLQKMGWSEGKGLGAMESGQTDYIKVSLKDNMLGIGAEKESGDNWLENAGAFDDLLANLNQGTPTLTSEPSTTNFGRLAHRKKFQRNKQVSNYDSASINTILGKKANGEAKNPVDEPVVEAVVPQADFECVVQKKSVKDYFAEKMKALGLASSSTESRPFGQSNVDSIDNKRKAQDELEEPKKKKEKKSKKGKKSKDEKSKKPKKEKKLKKEKKSKDVPSR